MRRCSIVRGSSMRHRIVAITRCGGRIRDKWEQEQYAKDICEYIDDKAGENASVLAVPYIEYKMKEALPNFTYAYNSFLQEDIIDTVIGEQVDFLVLNRETTDNMSEITVDEALLSDYGIDKVSTIGDYDLYENKKKFTNLYTITQYAEATGSQGMFYTITDLQDHLVIIDGGWDADAEQVLNVIANHDGKVDAWILTHAHQDHISAFNNLMEGDFDIEIGQIYTVDMDYDYYASVAAQYDGGFEHFERFLRVTEDMNNITYLHRGDELNLIGLNMKVLNAFDDSFIEEEIGDPCNNGSLMFKLTGTEGKTMLFCADVTPAMESRLREWWSDELKCDYLQLSHHGILGTFTQEMYEYMDPKLVFFNLSDGMVLNPDMNAKDYYDMFTEKGCTIYTQSTAPNEIEIK